MRRLYMRKPIRGQTVSEFALVLPLLLLLLVGILDFGRVVFAYNSVSNAARTATRVAIVNQTFSEIEGAAQAEAVGLNPVTVTVTYDADAACAQLKIGCLAIVEVEHQWTAATPILGSWIGPITVSSDARMPVERVFPAPTATP